MELPAYSVSELNEAIGVLLERGFAPRFLVDGAVVKPVLKKGHLWFSLSDGDASIQAVAWASTVARLSFRPNDGDGVRVVGKLNFWGARASLSVQALDIRPSLSTVLRRFEQVKQQLEALGGSAELRMAQRKAGPVVTDQGNLVLDAKLDGGISDPLALEQTINNIPGVLENGLFVNITDEVLVGEITDGVAGVRSLEKRLS